MGQSLDGLNIQDTFLGLIKTNGCNQEFTSSQTVLTDGGGNDGSLSIATAGQGIVVTGNVTTDAGVCAQGGICTGNDIINSSSGGSITICSNGITTPATLKLNSANGNIATSDGNNKICISSSGTDKVTLVGTTCITGDLKVNGDVVAFCSSDKRLKDNIKPLNNNSINCINSYEFDWNEKSVNTGKGIGFIAQEVQEVYPDLVIERQDGYLAIDYVSFIPVLLNEIKELKQKVEALEKK
jgi:hypothetical protein